MTQPLNCFKLPSTISIFTIISGGSNGGFGSALCVWRLCDIPLPGNNEHVRLHRPSNLCGDAQKTRNRCRNLSRPGSGRCLTCPCVAPQSPIAKASDTRGTAPMSGDAQTSGSINGMLLCLGAHRICLAISAAGPTFIRRKFRRGPLLFDRSRISFSPGTTGNITSARAPIAERHCCKPGPNHP